MQSMILGRPHSEIRRALLQQAIGAVEFKYLGDVPELVTHMTIPVQPQPMQMTHADEVLWQAHYAAMLATDNVAEMRRLTTEFLTHF